ncbi:2-hydroxyacyl-CoA dehydratase subunit D [Chloroflexota bacterium]
MDIIPEFQKIYTNRHTIARNKKKEEGKKVAGCLYSLVPEEMVHAAGMVPIQVTEGEEGSSFISGRSLLPDFYCDFMHSCLGQVQDRSYDYLDALISSDGCGPMRELAGLWKLSSGVPFFMHLTVPRDNNAESRIFHKEQLTRLKIMLEDCSGNGISDESLRSAIEVYNENRRLLRELYELRLQDKLPICGSELLDVVKAGLVMPKDEHNGMVAELLKEVSSNTGKEKGEVRLMVSLLTFEECTSSSFNIVKMVEDLGSDVVYDDLCWGGRYSWDPVKQNGDPLEALTGSYIGRAPTAYKYSQTKRADKLLQEAERYRVDGAIFVIPLYCEAYCFQYAHISDRFKQQGIPNLLIESQAFMPVAPLRTRVEAFLEMLGT